MALNIARICRTCASGTVHSVNESTVNLRITAPLGFKRHFDTELLFSLYFHRLLYLLDLGAT